MNDEQSDGSLPLPFEPTGKIAGSLTAILTLLVTSCFFVSVIYEAGYYFNFDISLMRLLDASDYAKSATVWAPIVIMGYLLIQNQQDDLNPGQKSFISYGNRIMLCILAITFALALPWLSIMLIFVVMAVVRFGTEAILRLLAPAVPAKVGAAATALLLLGTLALMLGLLHGAMDVSSIRFVQERTINIKIRGQRKSKEAILVSYIDRGLIVRSGEKLSFLPWSSVDSTTTKFSPSRSISDLIRGQFPEKSVTQQQENTQAK